MGEHNIMQQRAFAECECILPDFLQQSLSLIHNLQLRVLVVVENALIPILALAFRWTLTLDASCILRNIAALLPNIKLYL